MKALARRGGDSAIAVNLALGLGMVVARVATRPFMRQRLAVLAERQHSQTGEPQWFRDDAALAAELLKLTAFPDDLCTECGRVVGCRELAKQRAAGVCSWGFCRLVPLRRLLAVPLGECFEAVENLDRVGPDQLADDADDAASFTVRSSRRPQDRCTISGPARVCVKLEMVACRLERVGEFPPRDQVKLAVERPIAVQPPA